MWTEDSVCWREAVFRTMCSYSTQGVVQIGTSTEYQYPSDALLFGRDWNMLKNHPCFP
jgi:hypothetical protein